MGNRRSLLIMLVLLALTVTAEGANWFNFIQNEQGEQYFIDLDSIQQVSEQVFRVTEKVEPDNSGDITSLISHVELDCKKSRMKMLSKTTNFKSGDSLTEKGEGVFQDVRPEDIEESLFELVCSLKKSR